MRRLRDCLARGGGSGRRRGGLRRHRPGTGASHARSGRRGRSGGRSCGARSLARAREFSWERTARLTHEVYEEAQEAFWPLKRGPSALVLAA